MGFEAAPASKSTRATTWGSQEEALSLYRASIEVMPRMPEVSALYELFFFEQESFHARKLYTFAVPLGLSSRCRV